MLEINRQLLAENAQLLSEKRAMRDSIVGHMCHEREMLHEISSLKRHLGMAIEERDEALLSIQDADLNAARHRKRKRQKAQ